MSSWLVFTLTIAMVVAPGTAVAEGRPKPGRPGFRLLARALGALTVNRVYCGLMADGSICVDSTGSGRVGGGFWPKGTANQYVFNSGLQLAGIIDQEAGFQWAGDTSSAVFYNPSGPGDGEAVRPIFNTSDPADLAAWPAAARVPEGDASELLFNPLLRDRPGASQADVWWLSWDGNPRLAGAFHVTRPHPLGVLLEHRGMGWNFPTGNEDILYFIYTIYNITSIDPAAYAAVRPALRDILLEKAGDFQRLNEAEYGSLPDQGYRIEDVYVAFGADMDVADAGLNYASVNLPFDMGYTYEHSFSRSEHWTFDPGIFGPPFFPGHGLVGVKYLQSPVDAAGEEVGLTVFGLTANPGFGVPFHDAFNANQLYRYLSANVDPGLGDAQCNTGDPKVTRICYLNNAQPTDIRFFQSSGPLTLAPGEFASIVVAYIFAAPVEDPACSPPCDIRPEDPTILGDPARMAAGVNPIDRLTGYRGFSDANGDGKVEQEEFEVVPGSLLGKALVAQAVFDKDFLLPFPPEVPNFFLVSGDNQVTVLWQPSRSETTGDPFFAVAAQPTEVPEGGGDPVPNVLFDPNYRQLDVEGYRIYRGRVDTPSSLTMIAQFDYSGTFIRDFTGAVNPIPGCAPELGINVGDTTCVVPFDSVGPGVAPTVSIDLPLAGPIIQVATSPPSTGRITLATGEAFITRADTVITGAGTACAGFSRSATECQLRDTGVPFVFVDRTARNNLRYFYSVTAFDINSFQSGPSSLESPRNTKAVTPSALASNFENTTAVTTSLVGRGQVLDTTSPLPTIDPATGIFSGPFPPASGWSVGLGETVPQVLSGETQVSARLDSIQLGSPYQGLAHQYWLTVTAEGVSGVLNVPVLQAEEIGVTSGTGSSSPVVPVNEERAGAFGGSSQFKLTARAELSLPGPDYLALYGRGCVNARPGFGSSGACAYNGSRWFAGPSPQRNETQSHPIAGNTVNFSNVPMTGNYNNAGALPGVATIHQTQCYQSAGAATCRPVAGIQSGAKRAADFNLYWGAGGVIDSVIDATHNVAVPFDSVAGGTWGALNQAATVVGPGLDASDTLTNADFACVEPFRAYEAGGFICPATTPPYRLSKTAVPGTVGFFSGGSYPPAVPIDPAANAGFALYLAGDMFTFELSGGLPPAAGTVWSLRQYAGAITGGQGAAGDLGPYTFSHPEEVRPMTAVGAELRATLSVTNQVLATTKEDLSRVHTVPDPYYVTNAFERTTQGKIIQFVNLPADCIIRIYSSSGILVTLLEHHSNSRGGTRSWNVLNRNNHVVGSGVYFYHIESGNARRVGRFTIVNFAE